MVENIGQPNLKVELTSSPAAKPGFGNVRRGGIREGMLEWLLVCEVLKLRLSWRAGLIQR